ncbi:hypothetical protein G114_01719 [Aeromonas diversa CDC 2478-85]|uniref:Uncharacterized protein n=1 Tax=Aeromonas diversa CDC 2478-85 TaxID=1268237 RepID=N9VER9_9GAMM|nr:hypothetical protein [Aeromonas diversa]ENY73732.1 hypothetical protein G114_01719 [Aeromonas diversa CDC 2478-85]
MRVTESKWRLGVILLAALLTPLLYQSVGLTDLNEPQRWLVLLTIPLGLVQLLGWLAEGLRWCVTRGLTGEHR